MRSGDGVARRIRRGREEDRDAPRESWGAMTFGTSSETFAEEAVACSSICADVFLYQLTQPELQFLTTAIEH